MKKILVFASIVGVVGTFGLSADMAVAGDVVPRVAASRAAVKQFFGNLKGQLVSAIKAGGPENAIDVCNQSAPQIATEVSEKVGWRVARTSLKLRNPSNAPDDWEESVLREFEARKAAGEDPAKMEYAAYVPNGKTMEFRYMKAIPTAAKPCLACHAAKVPAGVEKALAEHYPDDKARGYKAGDIRGAFTITQPVN